MIEHKSSLNEGTWSVDEIEKLKQIVQEALATKQAAERSRKETEEEEEAEEKEGGSEKKRQTARNFPKV